jgi:hypothetical protein
MTDRDLFGHPTNSPSLSFEEWLRELDAEYEKRGGDQTGKSLVAQSGRECWRDYYDDGYSPADALSEDWSYQ